MMIVTVNIINLIATYTIVYISNVINYFPCLSVVFNVEKLSTVFPHIMYSSRLQISLTRINILKVPYGNETSLDIRTITNTVEPVSILYMKQWAPPLYTLVCIKRNF